MADVDYAAEMLLPKGKACADCLHVKFCVGIGCTKPGATSCDYYPSRFGEAPASKRDKHYQAHHAAVEKMIAGEGT